MEIDIPTTVPFNIADFDHDGAKDIGIARSGARNVIYFGSL